VGSAAVAGGIVLFVADLVFVGAGKRSDPGISFELHCGHVWRKISIEGGCVIQAVAGRDSGVRRCDSGIAY